MAKGNIFIKKAHAESEYTPEMLMDLKKCINDPVYFIKKFVKIQHPVRGCIPFELYDYQVEIINMLYNNKDSILLTSRQMGKTTTVGMFLLWYAIFKDDKTVLIASKDNSHAIDIQDRIKYAYEELPHWLKPGVVWYNRHSMMFDNGSQIVSSATTEKTGRGYSISFLYLDEFAFINKRIQEALWASIAPTLATGGSCIISSTPNGDSDLFANLWRGALSKANTFAHLEVNWRRHPDRDDAWAKEMLGKLGDLKFRQECENEFVSSDALLIDSVKLNSIQPVNPVRVVNEFSFWSEEIGGKGKSYLVGVDVGTGVGNDFSTVQVIEFPQLIQIAEFRTNELNIPKLYNKVKWILNFLTAPDNNNYRAEVTWSFENNGVGAAMGALYANDEKQPEHAELISTDNRSYGMVTTGKNKIISCLQLKSLIEKTKSNLTVKSALLLFELKHYTAKAGSYSAKIGATDDLIAALLIVMQLLRRMADYDEKAYQHIYHFDQSHYDPTSEAVDEEEDPFPFLVH